MGKATGNHSIIVPRTVIMATNYDGNIITDYGLRNPRSGRGGHSQINCRASQVVIPRNPYKTRKKTVPQHLKIATWNVQSMYESGKAHNIVKEMNRLQIDILGISETRWPNSGECKILEHTIYHSGNNTLQHRNGTAIIVTPRIKAAVKSFTPFSDRIMLLQIQANPIDLNIIQIYAPTADKDEATIEEFYAQLESVIEMIKKREITLITGDFNAKVGKGRVDNAVGGFGLGERNDRGDRLVRFCQEHDMLLSNTLFKLPNRRIYTWKSPGDSPENIIRNQIDYIAVPTRFKNAIKSAKTYPGADVPSDHNPVVCRLDVRLKRLEKKVLNNTIDIKKLSDPSIEQQVREHLSDEIRDINENTTDIREKWDKIKYTIQATCTTYLKRDKVKKKEWMTDEILNMMEERRQHKNKNEAEYRKTHNTIRTKIREAKGKWLSEKCTEIERCEMKYDYHNMHTKIKELTNKHKSRSSSMSIMDANGSLVSEPSKVLETWKLYVEQLFDSDRSHVCTAGRANTGPAILKSEVENAILSLKNNKAPGPDNVRGELLKILCRMDNQFLDTLTALFNSIYNRGEIPEEWLQSTFVAIPKKTNAKLCDQHRLISLINHITKIFTKIIHGRIYNKCESNISESQFGFRNALGTREAIFSLQVLIQRCRDMNKDAYVCFADFSKAFDNVKHEQLLEILRKAGIDDRDIRIIKNLYWGQCAKVKIDNSLTGNIEIKKGVRQGCVLSPLLFNIYSEEIFRRALENAREGIKINGELINNIRYADDTVILASNVEELQQLMERVNDVSSEFGLSLNLSKTKWMLISKSQQPPQQLMLNNQIINHVDSYAYLGTTVNAKWDQSTEIRSRIEKARASFNSMRSMFTSRDLSLSLKIRLVKCYVFSVLLYGAEAWTLTEALMKRLEAFEMWTYRRILRISWTDHITNIEVIRRIGKEKEIVFTIKRRKLEYLGHIMRHEKYRLLQLVIQGRVDSKRGPGRRRHSWLHNLRQWFGLTTVQLFRSAANKIRIAMIIANVRSG